MSEQRSENLGTVDMDGEQQEICWEIIATDPEAQLLGTLLELAFQTPTWGVCYLTKAGLVECVLAGHYDVAISAMFGWKSAK